MRLAEARDQLGVNFISLGAREAALGEGFDRRRVDDAHRMPARVQVECERLSVSAGRLHAGVRVRRVLSRQPLGELREARRGVGEELVAQLTSGGIEAGVELELGDVDAKRGEGRGVLL